MKFRFLSVDHLKNEIIRVSKRFPLTVLDVLLTSAILSGMISEDLHFKSHDSMSYFLLVLFLGIPLTLAFHLISETEIKNFKVPKSLIPLLSLIPLVCFYFWLRHHFGQSEVIRYFHWALYCHLLVAFAPFKDFRTSDGFWTFNYKLFSGFLISRFFGLFLFVGLSLAVAATHSLLEINFSENIYYYLSVLCLILISSLHFLALVPTQFQEPDENPKLLKVFCQYVLVPLNVAYIVILYAYMAKIFVSGQWPKNVVSLLVSGVSVLGVFALLMMHTFQKLQENQWMRKFQISYYLSIIPLLLMGIVSISIRINQYHMTEKRYGLIVLSLWLIGIALYNLISKAKNIIVIPVSLFVVAFLTSFGPWGFYQVSLNSQQRRLTEVFQKNGALQNGHLVPVTKEITTEDANEMINTLTYLVNDHGGTYLPDYFTNKEKAELTETKNELGEYLIKTKVETLLKSYFVLPKEALNPSYIESLNYYQSSSAGTNVSLGENQVLMTINQLKGHFDWKDKKKDISFEISTASGIATLKVNEVEILKWELRQDLERIKGKHSEGSTPVWTTQNDEVVVYLVPRQVWGRMDKENFENLGISGELIIHFIKN